jgi:hypothetical protein
MNPTVYTTPFDAELTINGDPSRIVIDGRLALPTSVIAAETYANGTVYVTASNALRSIADFQRKVATIYFNGYWYMMTAAGALTACDSESDAIHRGSALAA